MIPLCPQCKKGTRRERGPRTTFSQGISKPLIYDANGNVEPREKTSWTKESWICLECNHQWYEES